MSTTLPSVLLNIRTASDGQQWKGARTSRTCSGVDFLHHRRILGLPGHVRFGRDGRLASAWIWIYWLRLALLRPCPWIFARVDVLVQVSGHLREPVCQMSEPAADRSRYIIVTPNQLTAASMVLQKWVPREKVNPGVFITIFLVVILFINYFGISMFGEIEFWLSSFKVITIIGLIILSLVLALGGGPDHDRKGFRYWNEPGAFKPYIMTGSSESTPKNDLLYHPRPAEPRPLEERKQGKPADDIHILKRRQRNPGISEEMHAGIALRVVGFYGILGQAVGLAQPGEYLNGSAVHAVHDCRRVARRLLAASWSGLRLTSFSTGRRACPSVFVSSSTTMTPTPLSVHRIVAQ